LRDHRHGVVRIVRIVGIVRVVRVVRIPVWPEPHAGADHHAAPEAVVAKVMPGEMSATEAMTAMTTAAPPARIRRPGCGDQEEPRTDDADHPFHTHLPSRSPVTPGEPALHAPGPPNRRAVTCLYLYTLTSGDPVREIGDSRTESDEDRHPDDARQPGEQRERAAGEAREGEGHHRKDGRAAAH